MTDGVTVGMRTMPELEYIGSWMGDRYITVSVKSPSVVDWQTGDYIMYRNEKFVLNYDPSVVKSARVNTSGDGFVYEGVKFNALHIEMDDVQFLDEVLNDNHVHYTSLPTFSFFAATVDDFADRVQANMNRYCEQNDVSLSDWWVILTPSVSRTRARGRACGKTTSEKNAFDALFLTLWNAVYTVDPSVNGEKVNQNVSINNVSVLGGLPDIYNTFGLHYTTKGRVLIIGAAAKETEHIFEYGKGNGLSSIERVAESDQKTITKLFAYGNSTNLPIRYYANLNKVCYADVTSVETEGASWKIDIFFTIDKFNGEQEESVAAESYKVSFHDGNGNQYEGYIASDRTYPVEIKNGYSYLHLVTPSGTTFAVGDRLYFDEGVVVDKWPSGHFSYINDETVLPDNLAVNNLMLPGFPTTSLKDWVLANGGEAQEDGSVTWKGHNAFFSEEKLVPYILSPNYKTLGVREASKTWDGSDDTEDIYPTIKNTGADVIVSADVVADNGVFGDGESVPNFHVIIPSLGADVELKGLLHTDAQVNMTTGYCGGRDFNIVDAVKVSNGWKLTLNRSMDDALDLYFPYSDQAARGHSSIANEPYQIRGGDVSGYSGDKFVLTGIDMPDAYIEASSEKLLEAALEFLEKNDYTRYTYAPKVDEVYMANQHRVALASVGTNNVIASLHDTLQEGDLMLFEDTDLNLLGNVYIDQLNIKEYGNEDIPTYDVILRNDKSVGTIERLQNAVDSLSGGGGNGSAYGNGISTSQAKSLIQLYGDKRYIRRDINDETDTELTANKFIAKEGVETNLITGHTVSGNLGVTGNLSVTGTSTLNGETTINALLKNLTHQSQLNDVRSSDYTGDGAFDGGYLLEKGNGKSRLIVDELFVRLKAIFTELEIRKISYAGGNIILSHAGSKILAVEWINSSRQVIEQIDANRSSVVLFRCYLMSDDGTTATENWWRDDDLARCQTFNIDEGVHQDVENTYYWRRVENTGKGTPTGGDTQYEYVDLSNINNRHDGTDFPQAGDTIVQMGNWTNTERQGFISLEVSGENAPAIKVYKNVNRFSLVNKTPIVISPTTTSLRVNKLELETSYDVQPVPMNRGVWEDIPAETGQSDNYHRCYYYDLVQHNGATWICVYQPASSSDPAYTIEEPSSTANDWEIYAQKGADGQDGADGADGLSAAVLTIPSPIVNVETDSTGKAKSAFDQTYRVGLKIGEETGAFTSYSVSGTPTGVTVSLSPVTVGIVVVAIDVRIQIPKDNTTFPSTLTLSCAGVISDGVSRSVSGTITLVAQKDGANGIDGQDGQDGQDGVDGTDAVNVMLSPETIILSQGTTSPYSIDLTNAFAIASVNKGTASESNFTVAVASVSHCTASVDSTNNKKVNITAIATYSSGGKSYYYDNGYVVINVAYGGITYQKRFTFYVNLLGTWKETVENDTKTAVAQTKYWTYDKDGNPVEQVNIGQFVQSSSQNTSKLETTVGDENGGLVKQTSEISQKVNKISLKVSEERIANLLPDPIFKNSAFTNIVSRPNITTQIEAVAETNDIVSPWEADGGRMFKVSILTNSDSEAKYMFCNNRQPAVPRVKLQAGKKYTFTVYAYISDKTKLESESNIAEYSLYNSETGNDRTGHIKHVYLSNKTDVKAGSFEQYKVTLQPDGDYVWFDWITNMLVKANSYGFYVAYAGAKLEIGEAATGMSYDYTKDVESGLVSTGIDIENRKIELTTDNLVCKNNNNEKTMWLDANGTLGLSGNVFTGMTKIESEADMETCFFHDGSTAVAGNNTGHTYVYGKVAFYFGVDGREEWAIPHDVWIPDLFKLTDVNMFTSGNWPSDILLVFPFLIPREEDTPFSTYDICRTWTTYKTDIGHLMTLDEMYMLAGRRFTIFGNGSDIRIVLPRIKETTYADGDRYYTLVGYTSFNLHTTRGIAIEYQVLAMMQSNMTHQLTGIVPQCVEIFHATPQIDPQDWEPSE